MVRRGAGQREGVRADRGQELLQDLPRRRPGLLRQGLLLDHADARSASTAAGRDVQGLRGTGRRPGPRSRADGRRSPRTDGAAGPHGLHGCGAACSAAPLVWLVVAYLGSLVVLLRLGVLAARRLHRRDRQAARRSTTSSMLWDEPTSTGRSPSARSASPRSVTVIDALLALPDRVLHGQGGAPARARTARGRAPDAAVGQLPGQGLRLAGDPRRGRDPRLGAGAARAQRARASASSATWLVFAYLWLPYMILPIYAGLERMPDSLLEASGDLGGAAVDDVPPRGAADGLPGRRRRLDLHLLAVARRLHHGADRRRHDPADRQRRLRQRRRGQQPAARGGLRHGPGRRHGRLPARRAGGWARSRRSDAALAAARDGCCGVGDGGRRSPSSTCRCSSSSIYSFNSTRTFSVAAAGLTLHVVDRALHNHGARDALCDERQGRGLLRHRRSRSCSARMASFAVARYRFFGRDAVSFLVVLPIALPGIVTGIALNATFTQVLGVVARPADDRHRPRDVLHRRRLQQRRRAAAADSDVVRGGVGRPRRRRPCRPSATSPSRCCARRCSPARCSPSRCQLRRDHRDHVHRRPAGRRCRSGSSTTCSRPHSCRSSTWSRCW